MYSNLRAEMARKGVTSEDLAKVLKKTKGTFSQKLTGKAPFSLDEAIKIKESLGVEMPLDELFMKEEA